MVSPRVILQNAVEEPPYDDRHAAAQLNAQGDEPGETLTNWQRFRVQEVEWNRYLEKNKIVCTMAICLVIIIIIIAIVGISIYAPKTNVSTDKLNVTADESNESTTKPNESTKTTDAKPEVPYWVSFALSASFLVIILLALCCMFFRKHPPFLSTKTGRSLRGRNRLTCGPTQICEWQSFLSLRFVEQEAAEMVPAGPRRDSPSLDNPPPRSPPRGCPQRVFAPSGSTTASPMDDTSSGKTSPQNEPQPSTSGACNVKAQVCGGATAGTSADSGSAEDAGTPVKSSEVDPLISGKGKAPQGRAYKWKSKAKVCGGATGGTTADSGGATGCTTADSGGSTGSTTADSGGSTGSITADSGGATGGTTADSGGATGGATADSGIPEDAGTPAKSSELDPLISGKGKAPQGKASKGKSKGKAPKEESPKDESRKEK